MQITCPNCGQTITAEHINIQKMAAVCPACHHVFSFDLPTAKTKRRKVKQPGGLTLRDEDHLLSMSFRTNWRLERNENLLGMVIGGSSMSVVTALLVSEYFSSGDVPFILPIFIALIALVMFYAAAVITYNKTHISMTDYEIQVKRGPLPATDSTPQRIDLAGVVSIGYEETVASKKEGYDTPRYRLWAEMADGTRRTILNDLVKDYAAFISQRMQEHLDDDLAMMEDAYDTASIGRLIDADGKADAESDEIVDLDQGQQMQGQWR
ncbi:MAG: hypothetical protein CL607_19455 [Anaerolineaceae bacterium]|nr:hypothetical protein [Anaerolineaceae bacterium]